jgi:hypothetical protein
MHACIDPSGFFAGRVYFFVPIDVYCVRVLVLMVFGQALGGLLSSYQGLKLLVIEFNETAY